MLESKLRHAATALLESAIHVAPTDMRDWGQAMIGELDHVQGPWAAAMWALGSSGVLAKQALAALIIPGQHTRGLLPDGGLLAESTPWRRGVLITGGVCMLASLLFFAAAPFRQAFGVALKPWHYFYQLATRDFDPGFTDLAKQAELRHDPEGLAFCAISLHDQAECARFADEAVRLDPNLIWVYAVIAVRQPVNPETRRWVEELERWDPQNALFPLITAESICARDVHGGVWSPRTQAQVQAWQSAMAAAFGSTKFDDYLDRVAQLNRRVVPRYGFYDPYEVQSREGINLPPLTFYMSRSYAQMLIQSSDGLEAKGERNSAREKYWTVALFGQLLDSQGRTDAERWVGTTLQAMAYSRLQSSAGKEGDRADAALFGYLARKFEPAEGESPWQPQQSAFGWDAARRTATVVEVSGFMILIFSVLLVIAMVSLIAGSRRKAQPGLQRAQRAAPWVILTGSLGLLFSSITLYLVYRPYWSAFQSAVAHGDTAQTEDLGFFLRSTMTLPGIEPHNLYFLAGAGPRLVFYAWTGVIFLGLIGLGLIILRHLPTRPRSNATP